MAEQDQIAALLIDVEAQLRQLQLWQDELMPAEALTSRQPFCIDTMNFPQWLQFVFLPSMYSLLETDQPLPGECGIAPMAEEYFRGLRLASAELEGVLVSIDQVLSAT
jgi:uncharacterized protein YqcC (DUF446 family)